MISFHYIIKHSCFVVNHCYLFYFIFLPSLFFNYIIKLIEVSGPSQVNNSDL